MPRLYSNNFSTTLVSAINAIDTSFDVVSAAGLPTLGVGDYFHLTIDDGSFIEIVRVDAVVGNTLSVQRGQESTVQRVFASGSAVELRVTAGSFGAQSVPVADDIAYDNTASGLTAIELQAAVDELAAAVAKIVPYVDSGDLSGATTTIVDGVSNLNHYHSLSMCEGLNGVVHMVYRKSDEHAIGNHWKVGYMKSSDGGNTWSAEQILKDVNDKAFVPSSVLCLPDGKLIIAYSELNLSPGTSTAITPSVYRTLISENGGDTWQDGATIDTINFTFARLYGRMKVIPRTGSEAGIRLGIPAYHRFNDVPQFEIAMYYSDDLGATWQKGTSVTAGVDGANEADFLPVTSSFFICVARNGSALTYFESFDAGATWTRVGNLTAQNGINPVAPTLDKFRYNGKVYVLLGAFARSTDLMNWQVASAADLVSDFNSWSGRIDTNTGYTNASGYHATIAQVNGMINIDQTLTYTIIRENLSNQYSLINLSRINLLEEIENHPREYTLSSGAITLSTSLLEGVVRVDTEADAADDDLDTISGGEPSQMIVVVNNQATGSRDVTVKSGTGNIRCNGDMTLDSDQSFITLQKVGTKWYEVSRSQDNTSKSIAILAGVANVPPSNIPNQLFISPEGGTGSDTLTSLTGGAPNQIITLSTATGSHVITLTDGGNLLLAGNFTLNNTGAIITLQKRSTTWIELSRSSN